MKIYKIKPEYICLLIMFSLSQMLYAQKEDDNMMMENDSSYIGNIEDQEIDLLYQQLSKKHMTGSVEVIDVEKELQKDQRTSIGSILNGKVPGLMANYNTWGTGNAVILVDGVPQNDFYLNSLNLLEIESISILKDALSKSLYGAQGDKGVILIKTKRGEIGKHKIRVIGEYGMSKPRAMPQYLNSADYMEKYNQAQLNDQFWQVGEKAVKYTQEQIDASRSGDNPAMYPNNDFYNTDYIKEFTTGTNLFADLSGGNRNVRYYVNTSWEQNSGWLNTPQADITNSFNYRGNLDFVLNEYMDMSVDAAARVRMNEQPNAPSIWNIASTDLPNLYPMFWDPGIITNDSIRNLRVENANLVNGQLLGGNSSYLNNRYGDFTRSGNKKFMERMVLFNSKLNVDLSFITKGLSAKMYAGMNFYNSLATNQTASFAVYEPKFFTDSTGIVDSVDVVIHGEDTDPRKYNTNDGNSDFSRQLSYFGSLNYNRTFGEHGISAVAIFSNDFMNKKEARQKDVLFHTGLAVNYAFSDKYLAEFSIMGIGSRKLAPEDRIDIAPSFGLGWILSEENFMSNVSFIDYLKLRSSYGISKNDLGDNWTDYFLYESTFSRGSSMHYNNRTFYNRETLYASVPNKISFQQRKDLSLGLDAAFLNRALNIELGYFSSHSLDNLTRMSNTYPQLLGFEDLIYNNYNSDLTQGIELGLDYTYHVNEDFYVTLGGNMTFISPKITKYEELFREGADVDLIREGTASDAMWGLKSDGLYGIDDFNADGSLIDGLPIPQLGAQSLQPGDIKYLDQNGDNIINTNDVRIIGNGMRTQYAIFFNAKFRMLEFYALGIGQLGDSNYRSGSYFRVFGNDKYSENVNDAYGPGNEDVNASHPRLSATGSGHNDRNSDFWIYKNNSFTIPTMQLTYHFNGGNTVPFLNDARLYLRASNIVIAGKNKQFTQINPGGSPYTMGLSVGLVVSF